jgi:hypothetical protein
VLQGCEEECENVQERSCAEGAAGILMDVQEHCMEGGSNYQRTSKRERQSDSGTNSEAYNKPCVNPGRGSKLKCAYQCNGLCLEMPFPCCNA